MSGSTIKNTVLFIISAIGSFIAEHLGGFDTLMKALLMFMLVDYLTGLAVAFVFHKSTKTKNGGASSLVGFKGIVKKLCMLLLVGLAVELDRIIGVDYTRSLAIMFFIGNEGISVLENMGLMGVPYPEFLHKALESMKDKGDKGEGNE